jgi:hypothetical protein
LLHAVISSIVSFIHLCRIGFEEISLIFLFLIWLLKVFIFSLGFQPLLVFIIQEFFGFSFFPLKVLVPFAV